MSNKHTLNMSASNDSKTVRFDVGGKIYKVSQSLLEQYPETMLARLASDLWRPKKRRHDGNQKENCNNSLLFIERDGERFKYCLDYMRDAGVVALPNSIPKDALIQDLIYYGFHNADFSKITVVGTVKVLNENFKHIDSVKKKLDDDFTDLQIKLEVCGLARYCVNYYTKRGDHLDFFLGFNELDNYRSAAEFISTDTMGKQDFDSYLQSIGLKYKKFENCVLYLDHR